MAPLKLAVIVDNYQLPAFARDVLDAVEGCEQIHVFSCSNTTIRRKPFKHGGYFLLNLFSVRNPLTRSVPITSGRKKVARTTAFTSGYEGAWQILPDEIVAQLAQFDVVLKFGMSLMRVPSEERLSAPILSYHHGDPDHFRGRPAGFWETAQGAPVMGQIVQRISNRLDAGKVAAFAETRVLPYSYRATLIEAFGHSSLLINAAIRNALAERWLAKPCGGRNYRLPSNLQVLSFVTRMVLAYLKRLLYGAFVEKKWKVSVAPAELRREIVEGTGFPSRESWTDIPERDPYLFYADPFYAPDGEGILVEALDAQSGRGEIVRVTPNGHDLVLRIEGHLSYPCGIEIAGRKIVLPEMAVDREQEAFLAGGGELRPLGPLRFDRPTRVVDPTLFEHEGRLYLFGNRLEHGALALFLWSALSLEDRFEPHPLAPLLIAPRGGRMAGNLLRVDGRLLRFGQTFLTGYGDGVVCYEIDELSAERYREHEIGELRFDGPRGPHTLNFRDGEVLFDWYVETLSLAAGLRRLRARRRAA